jgi:NitT/TauT family transport system substrate-binding protein
LAVLLVAAAAATAGCAGAGGQDGVLRLGYFPNVTHAQALVGIQDGLFQKALGSSARLEPMAFNAGPTAIQALVTGQVDATYVGPSPTLSAIAAAKGVVVIVAGAASGGARFIVQPDARFASNADLAHKTFASPQLGNTQDVSLKHYLAEHGQATTDRGGSVQVINAANPDILALFRQKSISGAWVPEPWATRLEREGGGVQLVDERDLWPDGKFVTTHLVTTQRFLDAHPDLVAKLLEGHVAATERLRQGGASVLPSIQRGIAAATGQTLDPGLLAAALTKLNLTNDPLPATLLAFAKEAKDLGLSEADPPAAADVYRLAPLDAVLAAQGRPPVATP